MQPSNSLPGSSARSCPIHLRPVRLMPDGTWKELPRSQGQVAISAGYTLERATCGLIKAVKHKVVCPSHVSMKITASSNMALCRVLHRTVLSFVDPSVSACSQHAHNRCGWLVLRVAAQEHVMHRCTSSEHLTQLCYICTQHSASIISMRPLQGITMGLQFPAAASMCTFTLCPHLC